MTLYKHTFLLKFGIAAAGVTFAGLGFVSNHILPFYPRLVNAATRRSGFLFGNTEAVSPYIAYGTMLASVFYALIAFILLFYLFEKTQSVEAHFFMFFVFSFIFEVLRAALPLREALDIPGVYLSLAAHILVFFRYFGLFSLFCAGLYAAGLKTEREENFIFPLFIITMFISFNLPVNIWTWDTSLYLVSGYPFTFRILEITVALGTVFSFFCAAFKSGIKEYYSAGIGALCALLGRALLFSCDSLVLSIFGIILLIIGTVLICFNLRSIYLWI
jgi:hypothetical protein